MSISAIFFWPSWFNLLDLCELIQAYPNLFWHILADIFKSADGVFPDENGRFLSKTRMRGRVRVVGYEGSIWKVIAGGYSQTRSRLP